MEDCIEEPTTSSAFDRLSANIKEIQEKYNSCTQVPDKDRKKVGEASVSTAKILADMAKGCFVGLLKGFINGLKDIITGFWDLAKLGFKLAKKFGKKMVNYLHLAYKSGITTLFSEYARDTQSFLNTVLKGLKAIPEMILGAGVKQIETFKCYNTRAKADYVCKTMSYLGTDVLLAVLTAGGSKIAYVSKIQKAIKLGVTAQKAKLITKVKKAADVLDGIKAKRFLKNKFKGFNPALAGRRIDQLDDQAKVLKKGLDKADLELKDLITKRDLMGPSVGKEMITREIAQKERELTRLTQKITKHNTDLSHLRAKKLIYDLDKQGAIEIKRVIPDGKKINDLDVAKGRYPPWSEGGPVYEIKVKKKVELCRGGAAGEAAKGAGRWFLPCATKNYRTKDENRWVNATADNPYDEFSKYKLREGDVIQIGGINPILSDKGGSRVFTDKASGRTSTVRGGGGEVQVFRPSRDKLGTGDLVRTVKVYNDPEIRKLQAQLVRIKNKEEVLKIKKKISSRVDDTEASSFLLEVEDKLSGLSELNSQ